MGEIRRRVRGCVRGGYMGAAATTTDVDMVHAGMPSRKMQAYTAYWNVFRASYFEYSIRR